MQMQSQRGKQRYISTKSHHRREVGEGGHRHATVALRAGKNSGALLTKG